MNFPKTHGQCNYMRILQSHKPIIVATGPAGTGKTMFACQLATENLMKREIERLVLHDQLLVQTKIWDIFQVKWKERWSPGQNQ